MDSAAQCHWSMLVTGLDTWDVAVLLGGNDWRWYRLNYDEAIATALQEKGYDFWHNYVEAQKEPPIDGSSTWTEHIKRTFAKHTEVILEATEEDVDLIRTRHTLKANIDDTEKEVAAIENILKARIGDAAGIRAPDGTQATWKLTKDSVGTNYEAIALQLAVRLELSMEEQKKLIAENQVVTKKGSRRFLATIPKEK
jgi:predicted phage-related endonuclease